MSAICSRYYKIVLLAIQMNFRFNYAYAVETYICYQNPYRCVLITDSEDVSDLSDLDLDKLLGVEIESDISDDDL